MSTRAHNLILISRLIRSVTIVPRAHSDATAAPVPRAVEVQEMTAKVSVRSRSGVFGGSTTTASSAASASTAVAAPKAAAASRQSVVDDPLAPAPSAKTVGRAPSLFNDDDAEDDVAPAPVQPAKPTRAVAPAALDAAAATDKLLSKAPSSPIATRDAKAPSTSGGTPTKSSLLDRVSAALGKN